MKSVIFIDGQYLRVNAQIIEAFTPGVFNGKGVFETMLGLDGMVLDETLHLKRLRAGLKVLGIKPPSISSLILKQVLDRNHLSLARVRIMVWKEEKQAHVMAVALPYKIPEKSTYRVCLIGTNRRANDRLADVKSLDYGLFAEALGRAQARGFDEALLLNSRGHIFEASRANVFWIKDNVIYTPPLSSGCLNGITRQHVIKQARNLGITVKEKNLTPEIFKKADAAFVTNSLLGIKTIEITEIKIA
jgi:branched-subunit amino acid aminotransferase/4-amino-4-deoxychorismate lyase